MSSPHSKRQRLEVSSSPTNSTAEMAKISPSKEVSTQTHEPELPALPITGPIFPNDAQNFRAIVKFPGFVDRTLFMKELLEPEGTTNETRTGTQVMMFAPTKFGKTLIVDMSHKFFDIERNPDGTAKHDLSKEPTDASEVMKMFRRYSDDPAKWCKILKEKDFVKKHFGQHPVVRINFKGLAAEDKNSAIFGCAELVKAAYKEHEYLKKSTILEDRYLLESCETWCSYTGAGLEKLSEHKLGAQKLNMGLKKLLLSLRHHWKKEPILLVDEIDWITTKAIEAKFAKDRIEAIGTVISNLVYGILKSDEPIVAGALVTGISYLGSMGMSDQANTTPVYRLKDKRFSKFYGLTKPEIDDLLKLVDVTKRGEADQHIKDWYNGYSCDKDPRYCVYSVLSYIDQIVNPQNNGTANVFWSEGSFLSKIANLLRQSMLMVEFTALLNGESLEIQYPKKVDGGKLIAIFDESEKKIFRNTILSYFYDRGCLTHDDEKSLSGEKMYLKIPNREVKYHFNQMFEEYFAAVPQAARVACGEFFRDMSPDITKGDPVFEAGLQQFFDNLKTIFENAKCHDESEMNSLMWLIMNDHAEYDHCRSQFTIKGTNEKGKEVVVAVMDLWMRKGTFAVISEYKVRKAQHGTQSDNAHSGRAALEDIVPPDGTPRQDPGCTKGTKYLSALDIYKIEKFLLVGLSVDVDHKPELYILANSKNWDDVIVNANTGIL